MASPSPASRLLATAARTQLQPLGLRRFGRSRQWIDDHGWWLCVVDFSASQWAQGSALTVAAMWLWQDVDHLTFDVVERVAGSQPFRSEPQFTPVAEDLADRARAKVLEFRDRFSQLDAVARYLTAQPIRSGYLWESYHAGMAAGLVGDVQTARSRFAAVLAEDAVAPWILDAQHCVQHLVDLVEDPAALRTWAREAVAACRVRLSLAQWPAGIDILSGR